MPPNLVNWLKVFVEIKYEIWSVALGMVSAKINVNIINNSTGDG